MARSSATLWAALRSEPLIWTSMGAGSPRFRTASTNPPDWRYAVTSGTSAGCGDEPGPCTHNSCPGMPLAQANLDGRGVMSRIARVHGGESRLHPDICDDHIHPIGGTSSRISFSTRSTGASVRSMRVPVGAFRFKTNCRDPSWENTTSDPRIDRQTRHKTP